MPEGSITLHVPKGPDEAFAYVSDFEKAPEWISEMANIQKVTPGEVGVGTRFTQTVSLAGAPVEMTVQVTEYDPPRVYAYDGEGGPAQFTARFTFEPDGDGTRIRHDYDVTLGGALKLMGPMVGSWLKKNTETAIEKLERRLSE